MYIYTYTYIYIYIYIHISATVPLAPEACNLLYRTLVLYSVWYLLFSINKDPDRNSSVSLGFTWDPLTVSHGFLKPFFGLLFHTAVHLSRYPKAYKNQKKINVFGGFNPSTWGHFGVQLGGLRLSTLRPLGDLKPSKVMKNQWFLNIFAFEINLISIGLLTSTRANIDR